MIRALVFDMDGTLVDSEQLHYDAWKEVLFKNGVTSFPYNSFVRYVGSSNEQLAEDFIQSDALHHTVPELVQQKQEIYLKMIPDIRMLPGARELINRYHRRYTLAIASSSHRIELHRILETLELTEYFDHIVGGDMVSRKKPAPDIYLLVQNLLGLSGRECVAFEDSEPGIHAAKEAGMYSVAIPNSLSTQHNFDRADRVIRQLDQVDDAILHALGTEISAI